MRYIRNSCEDEIVLEFLKGELASARFGDDVLRALAEAEQSEKLISEGELSDAEQNLHRRQVLGICRGYPDREIFENYPEDIEWSLVQFDSEDIERLRYVDYDYWNELSSETSKPTSAADNIAKGITSCGVPNDGFFKAAEFIARGGKLPPIITLTSDGEKLLLLEGHLRATAYAMCKGSFGGTTGFVGKCSEDAMRKKQTVK